MSLILIIDDDTTMRRMICRALTGAGHSVIEAEDGRTGLRLAGSRNPDIVITDIVMPGMEGIETIREIRRVNPATRIVAISGAVADRASNYLSWAERLGADDTLKKPFRVADLLASIDRLAIRETVSTLPA